MGERAPLPQTPAAQPGCSLGEQGVIGLDLKSNCRVGTSLAPAIPIQGRMTGMNDMCRAGEK